MLLGSFESRWIVADKSFPFHQSKTMRSSSSLTDLSTNTICSVMVMKWKVKWGSRHENALLSASHSRFSFKRNHAPVSRGFVNEFMNTSSWLIQMIDVCDDKNIDFNDIHILNEKLIWYAFYSLQFVIF